MISAALLVTLASCGSAPTGPGAPAPLSASPAVSEVVVQPQAIGLGIQNSAQLHATAYDAEGNVIPDAEISWAVADSTVVSYSSGEATGMAEGSTTILASAGGNSGKVGVHVNKGANAITLTLSPRSDTLAVGGSVQIVATVTDGSGNPVNATVNWSSSDPSVATVDSGRVSAVGLGSVSVTAKVKNVSADASVLVRVPRPTSSLTGSLAAFPGAEGYGALALTQCDRSNVEVRQVTNLDDSGPGSLRDAIAYSDPTRLTVVIFRIGGTITLYSNITIDKPCLYIAGQTAPGGGIQVRAPDDPTHQVTLFTVPRDRTMHDLVIRYVRAREGRGEAGKADGIKLRGSYNVVLDHVSVAFANDKGIALYPVPVALGGKETDHITVQWSVIAATLTPHSTGVLIGPPPDGPSVTELSLHHNLLTDNAHRNPLIKRTAPIEIVNNVVYNWGSRIGRLLSEDSTGSGRVEADYVKNYFKAGPYSNASNYLQVWINHDQGGFNYLADPRLYMVGNIAAPMQTDPNANQSNIVQYVDEKTGPLPDSDFVSSPLSHPNVPITTTSASTALTQVLSSAGADARLTCSGDWVPARDALDSLFVTEVQTGTGPADSTEMDNQDDFGGIPSLSTGTPCVDSDSDGMPDDFEIRFGLDPHNPADATLDSNGDGYTNIEEYVNGRRPI